ncbi:MAG: sensor histidine kinase [Gaiellales bacterium]
MVVGLALIALGATVGWAFAKGLQRRAGLVEAEARRSAEGDRALRGAVAAAIADGLSSPVLLTGARSRVTHVNPACAGEFPSVAVGRDLGEVSASLSEIVGRTMLGETGVTTERVALGEPARALNVTAVRLDDIAFVLLEDVTEEVDFEEARRTFSSAVSHELRTPLARILGLAETLALPDLDGEREDFVMQIENEVEGIRKLIDEMLLLAALDRGRLAVQDGFVDAAATTRRIVEEARTRRIGRGHELRVSVPTGLELPVAARLFEVVVQNLVDNALIHGGEGAAVDVSLERDGDVEVLTVADTGVGIPPEHLPFVFQRFYRGDASRTGQGTGLGLALVKHIVEAHGGSVAADSDDVSGTTMRVRLPISA